MNKFFGLVTLFVFFGFPESSWSQEVWFEEGREIEFSSPLDAWQFYNEKWGESDPQRARWYKLERLLNLGACEPSEDGLVQNISEIECMFGAVIREYVEGTGPLKEGFVEIGDTPLRITIAMGEV